MAAKRRGSIVFGDQRRSSIISDDEVEARIEGAFRTFDDFSPAFKTNELSKNAKMTLFNRRIKSRLFMGKRTSQSQETKIKAAYKKMYSKCVGENETDPKNVMGVNKKSTNSVKFEKKRNTIY